MGRIYIIDVLFGPEISIGAAFYDAGVVFSRGDPGAAVMSVLANGIVLGVLKHIAGVKYRDLFPPSRNFMSGTLSQQRMGNTDGG